MITVALYNLKGGVGKTASCVNLAYLAAKDGFKTLLWDIDPQGSTTFYYKVKPKDAHGIKSLISKDANLESAILSTEYENLEIIGSDNAVKSFDIMMEEMKGQKNRLKGILKQLEKEYDFVFIDCPPGFSALSENIFNAADVVLMPIIPTTLSIRTYNMVKDYFKEKELDSSKLMCFFTMADLRKNMHNETMEQLYKDKKFFQNYIPYLSDVEKMGIHRQPIEEYARSSYAAKCYHDLWTEMKEGIVE
ncbi:ParA family protein [Ferruginibacter sp.]|uniref:ParA family protein n=1 Tax=Ferruginibacter sp. TaxID=1940288 RepID=UPI00265B2F3C|nr:ParA family protein [Ferruginibacter sp.]